MLFDLEPDPQERAGRRRAQTLALSVAGHAAAFLILLHLPQINLPEAKKSEYRQAIAGKEQKLIWYRFKELPGVTPVRSNADRKPPRAELRAKQEIVASPQAAPKRNQIVYASAPELKETKPVELPNILAMKMPEIRKQFVAPPAVVKQPASAVKMTADAPQLTAAPVEAIRLDSTARIARPFAAPPVRVAAKPRDIVTAEAPQIDAETASQTPLDFRFRAPARPFTPPPSRNAAGNGPSVAIVDGAPPAIEANNATNLNVAVVGLNPSSAPLALPAHSSAGQFSAGPKIRPEGADSAPDGKGISVPDLYINGSHEAKPDLIAQTFAAPTSALTLREAAKNATPSRNDTAASSQNGSVLVNNAPDPRLNGRDVYMMAIQMPNLTSYSGSWLMWYSDRTARQTGLAPIAPPEAHRKVDPKYIAAAIADRVEGKVQLACVIDQQGRVSNVELLKGLDDRLNQSAAEALAKWEFTPATRNGIPLPVDVVVEIPFRLEPRTQVR